MRDPVFIRKNVTALLKQLRPTGRAWQYPDDSDSALEQSVKSESLSDYLYDIENFVAEIVPDNDLFNEQAAEDWERRLDMDYDPDTLTLEERQAEINRKLSYPGGFKYNLTLEFIEHQLRASLFDVRVYRNPDQTQPAETELIANSVDKEDGFTITNYFHTFIIAGADINTPAVINSERRQEFIRKVLRYKPMNMVCYLSSTISKQDGTFKLKYNTYTCERIEETPPYATNVNITGTSEVEQTLTAEYNYNDDQGDQETGTMFQWYRADDNLGTNRIAIPGATNITYELVVADTDKFIQVGVTPANQKSFGAEVLSDYEEVNSEFVKSVEFAASETVLVDDGVDYQVYKSLVVNTLLGDIYSVTFQINPDTDYDIEYGIQYRIDGGSWQTLQSLTRHSSSPISRIISNIVHGSLVEYKHQLLWGETPGDSDPAEVFSNISAVSINNGTLNIEIPDTWESSKIFEP